MRRLLLLILALMLPMWALGEGWARVPMSQVPDTWLMVDTGNGEYSLAAVVSTPEGFALLEDMRFIPTEADSLLAEVSYSAYPGEAATPGDLSEGRTLKVAGRTLYCARQDDAMQASFEAGSNTIVLQLQPARADVSDYELLSCLPMLLRDLRIPGEKRAMPLKGLVWGMQEEELVSLLGVSMYVVPLAGDGWEGLQYVTSVLGAQTAQLDCCMRDGRLAMLICGLQEGSTDRVCSLLTGTLGEPQSADRDDLAAAIMTVSGAKPGITDAVMWRCDDAAVYLTRFNGVVMVLLTQP